MKQSGRLFQPEPRNLKAGSCLGQVIVKAKHIHSNDFDATSDSSIVKEESDFG